MTINAPASALLLIYQLVAAGQGIGGSQLTGAIQNGVLRSTSPVAPISIRYLSAYFLVSHTGQGGGRRC